MAYKYGASTAARRAQAPSFDAQREAAERIIERARAEANRIIQEATERAQEAVRSTEPDHSAKCATHSGYVTHLRKNETPCEPCRDASAAYHRAYRREARKADKARINDMLEQFNERIHLGILEAAEEVRKRALATGPKPIHGGHVGLRRATREIREHDARKRQAKEAA